MCRRVSPRHDKHRVETTPTLVAAYPVNLTACDLGSTPHMLVPITSADY